MQVPIPTAQGMRPLPPRSAPPPAAEGDNAALPPQGPDGAAAAAPSGEGPDASAQEGMTSVRHPANIDYFLYFRLMCAALIT
jgi:hypothetical protein